MEVADRKMLWGPGLTNLQRWIVTFGSGVLSALVLYALIRWTSGNAPSTPWVRDTALTIHLMTVIPALPLGTYLLLAPKGTSLHKSLGKVWLVLMLVTATSTLWIRNINNGGFSWIHLFVLFTYLSAPKVIRSARRGNIIKHRSEVAGLFIGALLIAGTASFLPGRTMWVWAFG
jgi:uncharacterized membrane protein